MFTIGVRAHYEAAHFLRSYGGVCSQLHGHRYEVEAVLIFEHVDRAGIAYDFIEADAHLRSITGELDHRNLNDLQAFADVETSAENQARYIYEQLKERMGEWGRHLLHVRVWETPQHWAQYSERSGLPPVQGAGH
jgi:6-pyruvoyltetrahydropterin/6-carboxytetrahydropterin synthase